MRHAATGQEPDRQARLQKGQRFGVSAAYDTKLLKISDPLVPPNPKEFDSA